ncbi:MAG TPA: tRNA pseudouridine(55) synthase TruB [Tepidisphaeraceae bacterium]|nr:tRNA pseudouridine(55) synthase TruB [Tepidisphaeraceae bacterium]
MSLSPDSTMYDRIINLDKPVGITSARAVAHVKRLLPRGVKVGHAGTLDPFATGVLLLLLGKATKRCEELMGATKVYETIVKLGATTPTLDPESQETRCLVEQFPTRDAIEGILSNMTGTVLQRPPIFSAMKVGGRRAYKLARQGKPVELPARPVRIDQLEILQYEWPMLSLRIECGRGTYIRSIARDLGAALSTGGYLLALRRTRVGEFNVRDAVSLQMLKSDATTDK